MNSGATPQTRAMLTVAQQLEVDRICWDFERVWRHSSAAPPALLHWLENASSVDRSVLFCELLAIDLEYRGLRQLPKTREDLCGLYPQFEREVEYVLQQHLAVEPSRSLPALSWQLATQQRDQLQRFIEQLEHSPTTEVPESVAQWTQQQLMAARRLQQTWGQPGLAAAGSAQEPDMLGDFRLIREIGRGGMGTVFEAEQESLHRRVALKVLWFGLRRDEEQVQRFEREATTIANLHHTNIVPIFAVGEQNGVNYYAMQLIEGHSLDRLMKQEKGVIDPQRVIDWSIQAAEALAHAHERGVIHRDIKPSNLMLDKTGRLWLTDFGLAKREEDHSLSLAGVMLGTPRYMSPEQASANLNRIDQRSDIYSLGATLYELLTGRPVFDGNTPLALVQQILTQDPAPIDRVQSDLPRDLATIVMKCLRKEPGERYASARELVADLRCVQEGRPILARRASFWEVTSKWVRRHRQSVRTALVALTACALIILGVVVTWLTVQQYYTTKLELLTAETPTIVEFFDDNGAAARPPLALPTPEALTLTTQPLTLRFQAKGLPSADYQWLPEPQHHVKFEIDPTAANPQLFLAARAGYRFVGQSPRVQIVSWTSDRLFIDLQGSMMAPPQIQTAEEGIAFVDWGQSPQIKWVGSLGSDLDGDGSDEVLLALQYQAAIYAVSRKTGRVWTQTFSTPTATTPPVAAVTTDSPVVRGDILGTPELVPDQDGDGRRDLLVCVGQNPADPPTDVNRVQRSVALVSAQGKLLWQYFIANETFNLPQRSVLPQELRWELAEPYTTGNKNLSSFFIRSGRRLRNLDREELREAPHVEAPQAQWIVHRGRNTVVVRAGVHLLTLDLSNGEPFGELANTQCVSAMPFRCVDIDADGASEVILVEALPARINTTSQSFLREIPQTRVAIWSVAANQMIREFVLDSKAPTSRPQSSQTTWPITFVDQHTLGTWLVVPWKMGTDVGYQGPSLPWSEIAVVNAQSGETHWNCRIPNMDCWTDQLATIPDQTGDGFPEVVVASMWGQPTQWVVECRSGASGELIWLERQPVDEATADEIVGIEYLPQLGRLQLKMRNGKAEHRLWHLAPESGRIEQVLSGFKSVDYLDFDGNGLMDWAIATSERLAGQSLQTLQVVAGSFRDCWRRLGVACQAAGDFDHDGITDLVGVTKDCIYAFRATDGALLWEFRPQRPWTEVRAYTYVAEIQRASQPRSSANARSQASSEAWDVDRDGCLDIVLQTVNIYNNESFPTIVVLSGKTGRRLWQSQPTQFPRQESARLMFADLDQDQQLDILSIEALPVRGGKRALAAAGPTAWRSTVSFFLRRWEVGTAEPIWTTPLSPQETDALFFDRWDQSCDLDQLPSPMLMRIDDDSVMDLVVISERLDASATRTELCLSGISGRDGRVTWSRPLGLTEFTDQAMDAIARFATADLDRDGTEEIVQLSFENRATDAGKSRRLAVLTAWEPGQKAPRWTWEYPVADDSAIYANSQWLRPWIGHFADRKVWIAMSLRNAEIRDVLVVVDAEGHLLDEHLVANRAPNYDLGFPCWILDSDGDGNDEVFCHDHQLTCFQVNSELTPVRTYPVSIQGADLSVQLLKVATNESQLVVASDSQNSATGFDIPAGKPLWRCQGSPPARDEAQQNPTVQVLPRLWFDAKEETRYSPVVLFRGRSGESIAQVATSNTRQWLAEQSPQQDREANELAAKPVDFRWGRPLPWSGDNVEQSLLSKPGEFATFTSLVLLASGLLIWLPLLVWRAMRRGWLTHLGALMLLFLVVAVNGLFFGQTFTIPFFLERPNWHDKLGVALQFAPMWGVLYACLSWNWQGQWGRGLWWLMLMLAASVVIGGLQVWGDLRAAPLVEGEYYRWSWSPLVLGYGFFAVSWIAVAVWSWRGLCYRLALGWERWRGQDSRVARVLQAWSGRSAVQPMASGTRAPSRYVRTLYRVGLLVAFVWIMAQPDWQGVMYSPETALPTAELKGPFRYAGAFGLDQSTTHYLWSPPGPGGALSATVRWPGQPVSAWNHIELDWEPMVVRLICCWAVWGGVLMFFGVLVPRERRDPAWLFVSIMTLLWSVVLLVTLVGGWISMGELPGLIGLIVMSVAAIVLAWVAQAWLLHRRQK